MTDLEKGLMKDVRFIIDKENRRVKCLPKLDEHSSVEKVAENIVARMVNDQMGFPVVTKTTLLNSPVFKGDLLNKSQCFAIAECSPGGVFDKKIGKQIAFNRLKLRLEEVASKIVAKIGYNAYNTLGILESDKDYTLEELEKYMDKSDTKKEWF